MPTPITADEAKARAQIAAMAALIDLQDWERLERCLADQLTVDYTSLWGGEPQELSRDELLKQWQALLPGFDATRHELGPILVQVDGNVAQGQAPVSGTHVFEGDAWIVEGRYRVRLSRDGKVWRIAALAYLNESEQGDRALTDRAKERVKSTSR